MRYQTAPRPERHWTGTLPGRPRGRNRDEAGDGNRTRSRSLEGSCATSTPHPRPVPEPIIWPTRRRPAVLAGTTGQLGLEPRIAGFGDRCLTNLAIAPGLPILPVPRRSDGPPPRAAITSDADERTRTSTPFREPGPKPGASTSSATSARPPRKIGHDKPTAQRVGPVNSMIGP